MDDRRRRRSRCCCCRRGAPPTSLGFLVCAGLMGVGAVAAVRPRPRALPAVRVPARRRDRDRRRLPGRGDPQSGPRAARVLRRADAASPPGIGAALAAWHVWIQAQPKGSGRRVRDGPRLHAGHAAAHRRDRARAEGQRRMRGAGLAVPGPRDPVVDVRVLHRDDRRGDRAASRAATRSSGPPHSEAPLTERCDDGV